MQKILLVEDDLIVQRVHTLMLTRLGCDVDIAPNGAVAMEKVKAEVNYKIIFVDIGLPGMSGFELIKLLRAWQKRIVFQIPIIVLTGFIRPEDEAACLEAGAIEVMHKPVLNNTFRELLDRHAIYCANS